MGRFSEALRRLGTLAAWGGGGGGRRHRASGLRRRCPLEPLEPRILLSAGSLAEDGLLPRPALIDPVWLGEGRAGLWADFRTDLTFVGPRLPEPQISAAAIDESFQLERTDTGVIGRLLPAGVLIETLAREDTEFARLAVADWGHADAIGRPELPVFRTSVIVPAGASVAAAYTVDEFVTLGAGHVVYPAQAPIAESSVPGHLDVPAALSFDEDYYLGGTLDSTPILSVSEPAIVRGTQVVTVEVSPFRYDPPSGLLTVATDVTFSLEFVESPPAAESAATSAQPAESLSESAAAAAEADYLIITADRFYDEVLPLAEWKYRKGFRTHVARVSEVGNTTDKVADFIRDAYHTGVPTSYVLLVGDFDDVPSNYPGYYVSDHLYTTVDGEDNFSDLTLGRLPVSTEAEAATAIEKILRYDRTPDMGDWYDDVLIAGYFEDHEPNGADGVADRWFMETSMHVHDYVRDVRGMTTHTALAAQTDGGPPYYYRNAAYAHRISVSGSPPYEVPQEVVDLWTSDQQATANISAAVNAGVSFIQHRNHGGATGWGHPSFHNPEVRALANGVKTPVVFSTNCSTGAFDFGYDDSFAEAWLKHENGGAVGVLGATRTSYSGYNDLLTHGIYTAFWPDYDPTHTGNPYPHSLRPAEAMNFGKYYMYLYKGAGTTTEIELNEFHWFGDPEMMLRTQTPAVLDVSHPAVFSMATAADVTVEVTTEGAPVAGALVAVSGDGTDDYWVGTTDAAGRVTFDGMIAGRLGDCDVVVTAADALPSETTIRGTATGPFAELAAPSPDEATNVDLGYVDVRWLDFSGTGVDAATLDATDLSIAGVTVDAPVHQGGDVWRYSYTGNLPPGTVDVAVAAGGVIDNLGDGNIARQLSFVYDVTGPVGSLQAPAPSGEIYEDPGYIDVTFVDLGGAGLDPSTLDAGDVQISEVTVDGGPQELPDGAWRYRYTGQLPVGAVDVEFVAGETADFAGNTNAGHREQFTYSPLAITTPATLPAAALAEPYDAAIEAAGGVAPYEWSLPMPLVITEVGLDSTDFIEIQNTSTQTVDTSGWVVAVSDDYTDPGKANATVWELPDSIAPGEILYRTDNATDENYFGANILFNANNRGWAMIVDDLGAVVDFVPWRWPASAVAEMSATIGGHTITIGDEFLGESVATTGAGTLQRKGNEDHNTAVDFARVPLPSRGLQNLNLTVPFVGGDLLPAGLTLDAATGTISGAPTEPGRFDFALRVTDAGAALAGGAVHTTTKEFSLLVEPPPPTLLLVVPQITVEGDGPHPASVSIPDPAAADLTVDLFSADATEVIVPASVTIAAGQTQAGFNVTIADDEELDWFQQVAIGASAAGYVDASETIIVADGETAVLSVELPVSATESDGLLVAAGTVTASRPPTVDVRVELSSDDPSEATVPATATILAGETTAVFDLTIFDDDQPDGPQDVAISARVENWPADNWTPGSATFTVADDDVAIPPLSVDLPAGATEGDADVLATVSIPAALAEDLVVGLLADDATELTVPADVTILAGETAATFPLSIVDDQRLDGVRQVTITASAVGFSDTAGTIAIKDNETAVLSVDLPATATEGDGLLVGRGTVSIDRPPDTDVVVTLQSDDPTELAVSATTTIPAGESSAAFDLTVVDDGEIDGVRSVAVTAGVENWTAGSDTIDVFDNETLGLTVTLPEDVWEGDALLAVAGAVSISGVLPADLDVSLVSDDQSEVLVPEIVTILAGETSAAFDLTIVDDADYDGAQAAMVTADADGFHTGDQLLTVRDDEVHHFTFAPVPSPQNAHRPFAVTVGARDVNDEPVLVASGVVTLAALAAADPATPIPIAPAETVTLTGGVWSGQLSVDAVADLVVLTADDGLEHTGTSNLFDVTPGPIDHFEFDTIPSPQYVGVPVGVALTARDAHGYVATSFGGTVNLSGHGLRAAGSTVLISECGLGGPDFVEIQNVSDAPVDTSGWRVAVSNDYTDPSTANPQTWALPATIAPGEVLFRTDDTGNNYFGGNIYYSVGNPGWAMILDAADAVVDFVGWGWSAAQWAAMEINVDGVEVTIDDEFLGGGLAHTGGGSIQRQGTEDRNTADDFAWTLPLTMGTQNVDLTVPFSNSPDAIEIAPTATGAFVEGRWTGTVRVLQPSTGVQLLADDGDQHTAESNAFSVEPPPPLLIGVPEQATEGDGTLLGSVSIPSAADADVIVALHSHDADEATVPPSVTIPAGETTVAFELTIVDDPHLDRTRHVAVSATADGYGEAEDTIAVYDNETATLSVDLPEQAAEGDGTLAGWATLSLDATPTVDVVVELLSSDLTEATVPSSVLIAAGQTAVPLDVSIVDDDLIDGTQPVAVTANVPGWTDGLGTFDVTDNEDLDLHLTLPSIAWEGSGVGGAAGEVAISGMLLTDLVVSLAADDTTELLTPASVTILAGNTSAAFDLTVLDDADYDGPQTAVVTASAAGFADGAGSIDVRDDDVHHFAFEPVPSPQTAGQPFAVTIRAEDVTGATILVYGESVNLSGAGVAGSVDVVPAVTGPLVEGIWTGQVTVEMSDTDVVLTADDGLGHSGHSNAFDVVPVWGEIRGTKFNDRNGDGVWDPDETGLPGWTIYIDLDADGQFNDGEPFDVTDADGRYALTGLDTGTYLVGEVPRNGWTQTFPGDETASDAAPSPGSESSGGEPSGGEPTGSEPSGGGPLASSVQSDTTHSAAPAYLPSQFVDGEETEEPLPEISDSGSVINVTEFLADPRFAGIDGSTVSVAILDTGITAEHEFFGPDEDGDGVADRIIFQWDFGENDDDADDRHGHGSNVASIIGSQDDTYTGMAPGVNLVVLKVFTDSGSGTFGDIEDALQWLVAHADEYNIVSVNMSISDDENHNRPKTLYGLGNEIATLASMEIPVLAASGNDFYRQDSVQGMSYPAADPNSIAIGAVFDGNVGRRSYGGGAVAYTTAADRIAPFTQRHETMLAAFAPGAPITGAGTTATSTRTLQGTSQASPHVAAMAALAQELAQRELGRHLTLEEFTTLLTDTAATINDGDDEDDNVTNTGLDFKRVDMLALGEAILAMARPAGTHVVEFTTIGIIDDVNFGNHTSTEIAGRYAFYNNSSFDGADPAPNAADDGAIALDKQALLPGQTATFANYTSYSRGINGIMIDVVDPARGPTASDFRFRVGNDNNPGSWAELTVPASVTVRDGAGVDDSDRVSIVFEDRAVIGQWMEITVLSEGLSLASDDVFYFGNAVAEAGNSASDARITTTDLLLARNNPRTFLNPAGVTYNFDYDRDQRVDARDVLLARNNNTSFLSALRLIDLSEAESGDPGESPIDASLSANANDANTRWASPSRVDFASPAHAPTATADRTWLEALRVADLGGPAQRRARLAPAPVDAAMLAMWRPRSPS